MSTAIQIDSRREVLPDQPTRGCCIDRLSRHHFSGLALQNVLISTGACSGGNFVVSRAGEAYDAQIRGLNRKLQLNSEGKGKTMLRTIVIILLVLFLLGALPSWPYSAHWGYYPSGGVGLLLLIVIILVLLDIL